MKLKNSKLNNTNSVNNLMNIIIYFDIGFLSFYLQFLICYHIYLMINMYKAYLIIYLELLKYYINFENVFSLLMIFSIIK